MTAIEKWRHARNTHEKLVELARGWCHQGSGDLGILNTLACYGNSMQALAVDWITSRKSDLYCDLIAYSRERLYAAALEARAECEEILAEVQSDLGSIEGYK